MKHLFAVLALVLTVTGCAKDKKTEKSPELTPFQKVSGGQWLSECQNDGNGAYKATLVLNGTAGTTSSQYFQNPDCSGAVVKTEGPTNFNYTSVNKAGGKDGEAKVTITVPGQPAVSVDVVVQGDTMVVIAPDKTMIYRRVGDGPGKQNSAMAAFDQEARGNWVTRDCNPLNGGANSYYQVLTIAGGGQARSVLNVFQGGQCQGAVTPQNPQDIVYAVDNFANGTGQIRINNGQAMSVTIQGGQLSLGSAAGTTVFLKIR